MRFLLFFLITLAAVTGAKYPDSDRLPAAENVLATLAPKHPRLFFTQTELESLKNRAKSDTMLRSLVDRLILTADNMLDIEPVKYELRGPRLLSQSRACLKRVSTLAFAFHLTGESQYVQRAKRELFAAAAFPDWNPSHFLDTAEMSNAFGIGYDWLYHELNDYDRYVIREALLQKGLQVGLREYRDPNGGWWARVDHNWNQVCNCGLSVGALAVADEAPKVCAEVLEHALSSLPRAMKSYGPDGGWNEGPGYWGYATRYTVYGLAALQSALGTDFGLAKAPGFEPTAFFPIHGAGPTDLYFNFADAGLRSGAKSAWFYLAGRYNQPQAANHQHHFLQNKNNIDPFAIIWYQPIKPSVERLPESAYYKGVQVFLTRSAWGKPDALYVGFKGGDNKANHSHLDLGTFVLDAKGQRWVSDLGGDNYNLPGYWEEEQSGRRWSYFRLNNFSHNTLTLNNALQIATAEAPIIKHHLGKNPFAVADLTEAYAEFASRVHRGIWRANHQYVLVQDEIDWTSEQRQVTWNVMTAAEIELSKDKRSAILSRNGKSLHVQLMLPEQAEFAIKSAEQEPPQKPNTGYQQLYIRWDEKAESTRIAVQFAPGMLQKLSIKSLSKW